MGWILSVMSENDQESDFAREDGNGSGWDLRRRKRGRNLAVLFAILASCVLFYVITIVRMV